MRVPRRVVELVVGHRLVPRQQLKANIDAAIKRRATVLLDTVRY
jgi:hypothetical protein